VGADVFLWVTLVVLVANVIHFGVSALSENGIAGQDHRGRMSAVCNLRQDGKHRCYGNL